MKTMDCLRESQNITKKMTTQFTCSLKGFIITMGLFLCSFPTLFAQDIHFSQFYNSPVLLNPGLTGIFNGNVRFMANYRSQWAAVPVDYQTFSAVADIKFNRRYTINRTFFSAGLSFNYDRAGYSKLQLGDLGLNGSITRMFSDHFFGTLGGQISINQRGFKTDALTFDEQFVFERGQYLPTASNGETFGNTSRSFVDFSMGFNFRLQALDQSGLVDLLDQRSKLDFGVGFHHLTEPNQAFFEGEKEQLDMRLSPYAMGILQLTDELDLAANIFGQFQGPYREYLGMIGAKVHIDRQLGNQWALQLGIGYRLNNDFGDAFMPSLEVFFNNWQAGFSYDVNVSDINIATSRRGGPELSVRYLFKTPKRPGRRNCPLI